MNKVKLTIGKYKWLITTLLVLIFTIVFALILGRMVKGITPEKICYNEIMDFYSDDDNVYGSMVMPVKCEYDDYGEYDRCYCCAITIITNDNTKTYFVTLAWKYKNIVHKAFAGNKVFGDDYYISVLSIDM